MVTQDRASRFNLLFQVGARLCALPLEGVLETMRPLPVRILAGLPPFILGLAVVRGTAIPVIDAHRLLVGSEAPAPASRFITLKLGVRRASLAVGEVVGIREIDRSVWQRLPPLLRDASSELVNAIGRLESELLLLLDSARVVPESVWSSLDARQVTT